MTSMSAFVPSPDEQESINDSPAPAEVDVFPQLMGATGDTVGTLDEVGVATESRLARLKRIGKPIVGFFSVQILVQILTMLSGLLLVRTMSKSEYAFYTVANSMQGTISLLGDSGISSALTAIGGVVWQDKRRFGELIQTGLEFRRKFGALLFVTIGPLMWWLLYSNGASALYAGFLCAIVLAGSSLSLVHGVLIIVPRLHSRVSQLQNAELMMATLRLLIIGAASFIFLNAATATVVVLITLGLQNVLYRRWASVDADLKAPTNAEDRQKIWKVLRSQAPTVMFFCIQGQITIVIIGLFGSANAVANVGALGRITIFFSIVTSLMVNVVLPRFARAQTRAKIRKLYFQIIGFYTLITGTFLLAVFLFAHQILVILGDKYAGLGNELIYLSLGASAAAMTGILYSLNATKGWLEWTWVTIPLTLLIQIACVPFLDLSSIRDVVILGAAQPVGAAIVSIIQATRAFRAMDEAGQVSM